MDDLVKNNNNVFITKYGTKIFNRRCKNIARNCTFCGIVVIFNDEHVNPYVHCKKNGRDVYICADCKTDYEMYCSREDKFDFIISYC